MKKSISYEMCPYDYIPDYEEEYKGMRFTVGLEAYGLMAASIEFSSKKDLYDFLNIDLDDKHDSEISSNNQMIYDHFRTSEFDTFGGSGSDQQAVLFIRCPYVDKPNSVYQITTNTRLQITKEKYEETFEKFDDAVESYNNQLEFVNNNPLSLLTETLDDEELEDVIDDVSDSINSMTLKFFTIESLSNICREFIDDYLKWKDCKSKHWCMLSKISSTLKDRGDYVK